MKNQSDSRRRFIRNSAITAGGILASGKLQGFEWNKAMNSASNQKKPFIGVQLDKAAFENRELSDMFREMHELAAINTVIYFFKDEDVKYGSDHSGGTSFQRGKVDLDSFGRDTIDRMQEAAEPFGITIFMGGGEMYWGNCIHKFPEATEIDCFGNRTDFSCPNRPEWRQFQKALHADLFQQHPYLGGFLFMHERRGPMNFLYKRQAWFDNTLPRCFCEHCADKGQKRGIDAEKAKVGFQHLVKLFEGKSPQLERDGVMVGFWRLLTEYPDVLAWEKMQWDTIFDYREDVIKAMRKAKNDITIGYHYQHAGLLGDLFWRVGEKPEYAKGVADFVKPSLYPGVSGARLKNVISRAQAVYLKDLDDKTAQLAVSGWFQRSPENGREVFGENPAAQSGFTPEWVKTETERFSKGAAPVPVYAGLGIGVPGSDQVETPEYITKCTEACFEGGAEGIILSRHYSEIKPKLLKAAGKVIKKHFKLA